MNTHAGTPAPARSPGRLAGWLILVLALTVVNYTVNFTTENPERSDALYEWTSAVGGLVFAAFLLLIVVALSLDGPVRTMLALRPPARWGEALGFGVAILIGTFVIAGLLDPILHAGEEQGLTPDGWDPDRAAQFVANFFVVAMIVPIVEELMFRGLGYSLLERFGRNVAIVAVGVAFAAAHGLVGALPIFIVFGAGLAWLRARYDSVYPAILVHGTFNGLALIAAVTLGGAAD